MKPQFCLNRILAMSLFIVMYQLSCGGRDDVDVDIENFTVKEEFNICEYWKEGMTWPEFLKVRNSLQRPELVNYVDKIEQQKFAEKFGIATPKTYIATREKKPIIDIIAKLPSYVAKMTHLSLSQGLIIVKNGVNIVDGQPITPKEVQDTVFKHFEMKARAVESWTLHQVKPGFMIQEYIPNRNEVKIQTIWGRAIIGEWRGGEANTSTTQIWGRYDRAGNLADGKKSAPEWWPKAVAAAEKMSSGTDALRVDFLVRENGELLLNELEIWPESRWSSRENVLEARLNNGYRQLCNKAKPNK